MSEPVLPPFSNLVDVLHRRFEARMPALVTEVNNRGARLHCRSHCSNCCNLAVFTTLPEATLIAASLTPGQSQALENYMSRLRTRLPAECDLKSFLRLCRKTLGFCPFIESDNCSVYALRPLACRALLSTRPAAWCGVDFSTLHPLEQQAYLSSLDPQLVDFPSHYLASSKRLGQAYERRLLGKMRREAGFALSGHLPTLVWLEIQLRISLNLHQGPNWIRQKVSGLGLPPSLLLMLEDG